MVNPVDIPGPPGPVMPGYKPRRSRVHDVSLRVAQFFDARASSKKAFHLDEIAKHTKLSHSQVQGAMNRLKKLGIATHAIRVDDVNGQVYGKPGFWMAGPNAGKGLNPSRNGSAVLAAALRQEAAQGMMDNGPLPERTVAPLTTKANARVRAQAAQVADRQILLFEVLRTREDGTVMAVGENGEIVKILFYDLD